VSGSKTTKPDPSRQQVLAAVRALPPGQDYSWDGADEDDRPLTRDEMRAGITAAAATRKRGRPAGSGQKEQVAIRLDRDVLTAFRADGPGWQTRVNEALKDWLAAHKPG
jgi:uncharacterized protein (DUF4415 family)